MIYIYLRIFIILCIGDDGAIRHCCKGLLEYHIVSCSIFDSIGPGKYYGNMIYIADGAKYDMNRTTHGSTDSTSVIAYVIHGKAQEYSNTGRDINHIFGMLSLENLNGLMVQLD
ncbi:hypothetical protein TWF970_010615 [Orbilia oligospora]|uniref:Uncharacterized protein n=1 Tax=Orbilia oligospora TaxID=2813651 RepID=A0A7C8RIC3_ORBOL|nr:hypothetical protein TWF970_010615 [Orbilia oligospora]